jgi:hypothetical protein
VREVKSLVKSVGSKKYLVREVKSLVKLQGSKKYLVREVKSLVKLQGSKKYLVREVKSLVKLQGSEKVPGKGGEVPGKGGEVPGKGGEVPGRDAGRVWPHGPVEADLLVRGAGPDKHGAVVSCSQPHKYNHSVVFNLHLVSHRCFFQRQH